MNKTIILLSILIFLAGCPSSPEAEAPDMPILTCENARMPNESQIDQVFMSCIDEYATMLCKDGSLTCANEVARQCEEVIRQGLMAILEKMNECGKLHGQDA